MTISIKNKAFLLALTLLVAMMPALALAQSTQRQVKSAVASGGYRYWLYLPDGYDTGKDKKTWPLVIFLHGRSLCGSNINSVLRYGTLDAINKGRKIPAVVIAPQNPGGSWKPNKLNDILDWAIANCDIDSTRVYVLGMSLGGYGTLDFAGTYPHRIAAAMALCGGTTLKTVDPLGELPLWIMHGTADRSVALSQSSKVVNHLSNTGQNSRLRYDWLPGASHGALARLFYLPQTYDWLFAHRLTDPGRPVNRTISITLSDTNGAYSGLKFR